MTPSDERLKWLIEFLEDYQSEDFGAYEFGHYGTPSKVARLKDWEVLKIADELKQFIARPDLKCLVRMDGQAVPLDNVQVDIGRIAQCRAALDVGIGVFTKKGPARKELGSKEGSYKYLFSDLPDATELMGR